MDILPLESPPAVLFKLRSLASPQDWQRLETLFKRRSLWFSSPDKFNDPFEGHVSQKVKLSTDDAKAFANRMAKKSGVGNRQQRRDLVQDKTKTLVRGFEVNGHLPHLDTIGVLCLMDLYGITRRSDEILAWSHYAGNHKGVAIGFSPRRKTSPNLFNFALRVNYDSKEPVTPDDARAMEKAILTKAPCWSYEREWRILSTYRQSVACIEKSLSAGDFAVGTNMHDFRLREPLFNAEVYFDPEDMSEVHLGVRLSEIEKARVVSLANSYGLTPRFVNVCLHPTEFSLVKLPYRDRA